MTISINDKNLENQLIELSKNFHINIETLIKEFLSQKIKELSDKDIKNLQINSMNKTWDNPYDEVWDDL